MSEPAPDTTETEEPGVPTEDEPATTQEPDTTEEEAAEEEPEQTPAEAAKRNGSANLEKAIEKQIAANRRTFERIFGQDLESEICAACGGSGFFGEKETQLNDLAEAQDVIPCPDCYALGQVRTGSKVPGQLTKSCARCNGNGYTTKPYEAPATTPIPTGQPATTMQPLTGQFIPGKGFQAFGSDEFIPLAAGS